MSKRQRQWFIVIHFTWIAMWILANKLYGKVPTPYVYTLLGLALIIAVVSTTAMIIIRIRNRK